MELRDRRTWIIGASDGVGEALARALAAEGARLALTARRAERLRALADELRTGGAEVIVMPADVTEPEALERVAVEIGEAWGGGVDVLVYAAGEWSATHGATLDLEASEQMIAVNLNGMVRAIAAVLPDMVARGEGDIVGIASVMGYRGWPEAALYGATTSAAITMLQSLRLDLAPLGVGVTTVTPGFVDTPLATSVGRSLPALVSADAAAERITRGLRRGRDEIHFPLRLTVPLKLFCALPRPLYEALVRLGWYRAPRWGQALAHTQARWRAAPARLAGASSGLRPRWRRPRGGGWSLLRRESGGGDRSGSGRVRRLFGRS